MAEYSVLSFSELHDVLRKYEDDKRWMFRGHRDTLWSLIPKAGRSNIFRKYEFIYFEAWKRRAVEYMRVTPPNNWEWLAVAQHHGLSTRLLDWSANPLISCFFAVADDDSEKDAVVYAYKPKQLSYLQTLEENPFAMKDCIAEYRPSSFAARISRQDGRFTIHCPPETDLLKNQQYGMLDAIQIASDYVPRLRKELDQYGYNYATIFPDLDGISRHLNWIASQRELTNKLVREEKELASIPAEDDLTE